MLPPGTYCLLCLVPNPSEDRRDGRSEFVCGSCGRRAPRALILDGETKTEETPRGLKHWTVGALIEREGKFLIMLKKTWPYLWDVIAGHIGPAEDPEAAVVREVQEETGLRLVKPTLAFHGEIFPEPCRRGVNIHEWYLFRGPADGELRPDPREVAELRWVTLAEMVGLPFGRPAYYIFDALGLWKEWSCTPLRSLQGATRGCAHVRVGTKKRPSS